MTDKKIIGLCGSLRKASLNRKLLLEAVRLYGKCDFKEANLNLPLYNGDEEDIEKPKSTLNLYNDIKAADGVIITSPEYNKGISGVLKNSLDWVSRIPGSVWKEKPVVIMSAAAGRTGGETSQYMVRACLTPFGPHIINSPIVCVAQASQQFDEDGQIISELYLESVKEAMRNLRKAIN
jgi:chromate reductase